MVSLHSHLAAFMKRSCTGAVCIAGILLGNLHANAAETDPLLANWLNAQTNVQTWSADFVQTRTLKSLAQPLTAKGRVWFAEPNRFRWELGSPPETIAIRSTNTLTVVYPRLKRAERYSLVGNEGSQWRDVLALLDAGFPRDRADLEARYQVNAVSVTNGAAEAVLQPRSASARRMMPQIRIAFSTNDYSLRATELQFADGSTMRNDFTNAVLNPGLESSLFMPELPGDYRVVEPLRQPR
jgi:outer membrane lipoprotein-sorting protein